MSGFYGDLSPSQHELLASFQSRVVSSRDIYFANQREYARILRSRSGLAESAELLEEEEKDRQQDFVYESLRFLRANRWKLDETVKHFDEYIAWRARERVDFILLERPNKMDLLEKVVPFACFGYSITGNPVYYERTGSVNVDAILQLFHHQEGNKEVIKIHTYQQELHRKLCREQSKRLGRLVERCITIADMSGLSVGHRRAVSIMIDILTMDQKYYPETLEVLHCINCPRIFPVLYAIVKPFLDSKTVAKIHVSSGIPKDKLSQLIEPAQLAKSYGGSMEEPKAFQLSDLSSILAELKEGGPDAGDLTEQTVKAGKKVEKVLQCKAGDEMAWFVKTAQSDIALEVFFTPSEPGGNRVIVFPWSRRDAGKFAFSGEYTAPTDGQVSVIIDNSFSYFTAKQVLFWISEAKPEDEQGQIGSDHTNTTSSDSNRETDEKKRD